MLGWCPAFSLVIWISVVRDNEWPQTFDQDFRFCSASQTYYPIFAVCFHLVSDSSAVVWTLLWWLRWMNWDLSPKRHSALYIQSSEDSLLEEWSGGLFIRVRLLWAPCTVWSIMGRVWMAQVVFIFSPGSSSAFNSVCTIGTDMVFRSERKKWGKKYTMICFTEYITVWEHGISNHP